MQSNDNIYNNQANKMAKFRSNLGKNYFGNNQISKIQFDSLDILIKLNFFASFNLSSLF